MEYVEPGSCIVHEWQAGCSKAFSCSLFALLRKLPPSCRPRTLSILSTSSALTTKRPNSHQLGYNSLRTAAMPTTTADFETIRWFIRPADLSDAVPCSALLQASYETLLQSDYSDSCLTNCLPLITVAQRQLLTCGTWYVVLHPETGQMVGCGGWTARPPTTSSNPNAANNATTVVPHLRHFAVHPSFTRKGIASLLWEHSLASIRSSMGGVPAMEVFSTLTAEPFYMSCGFQTVGCMEVELKKDLFFPCILMRREAEA
jgi:GNAT superfamily N-acetyltransferase